MKRFNKNNKNHQKNHKKQRERNTKFLLTHEHMTHSQQRAEERFYIEGFKEWEALKEINNDRCLHLKEDWDKDSRVFLIRYLNKYIRIATTYNVTRVKTVLPLKNDFDLINKLIEKISIYSPIAA